MEITHRLECSAPREVACASNFCSVRKPADGPPACDLASDTLGLRNGARVARINQLQVDAGLIGVSEILSVRRDVSVGRRIAGRIGSEPTGFGSGRSSGP
jgi:hypothetical protein